MEILHELVKILTQFPLLHNKSPIQFKCIAQERKKVIVHIKIFLSYTADSFSYWSDEEFRSNSNWWDGAAQSEQQLRFNSTRADTSAARHGCGAPQACKFCIPTPSPATGPLRESEERRPGRWRAKQNAGIERGRDERSGKIQQKPTYQRARLCEFAQILVRILWSPEGEKRWSMILCWGLEGTCHCLHL